MFITLSKEKYEKLKKNLTAMGIPHKAEITTQGLYHLTLPDLTKKDRSLVFDAYMEIMKDEEGFEEAFPKWVRYLRPKTKTSSPPSPEKDRQNENEYAKH